MHYRTNCATESQDLCPTTLLLDLDGVLRHWPANDHGIEAVHGLPPDARAFHAALRRTGAVAARTLFVDGSVANVRAAARLGMRTHLFHAAAGLQEHMEDLGVLEVAEDTARQ
ncbi:MAG TPA: HAD-IA family hydrolase [Roseateles sp.]|nr:HAD-IA family hydrolase [Roseateles sp.]